MFYSQFILAKKGPLGTIWIAAHLERKLRKNQVADTDISVSVDSILFPEVPIALRLSSHLLLGVVRIYSRKVNYLFNDCSEALVKIKQAFRSTAVDLPPEASTAPYHSITLPETFDLDDLELPDSSFCHGNFVDHHVTTREQITLQDPVEDSVYLGSQFGLDERFGDGDALQMGLDFDEDLFADRICSPGPSATGARMEEDVLPSVPAEEPAYSNKNEAEEKQSSVLDIDVDRGSKDEAKGHSATQSLPYESGKNNDSKGYNALQSPAVDVVQVVCKDMQRPDLNEEIFPSAAAQGPPTPGLIDEPLTAHAEEGTISSSSNRSPAYSQIESVVPAALFQAAVSPTSCLLAPLSMGLEQVGFATSFQQCCPTLPSPHIGIEQIKEADAKLRVKEQAQSVEEQMQSAEMEPCVKEFTQHPIISCTSENINSVSISSSVEVPRETPFEERRMLPSNLLSASLPVLTVPTVPSSSVQCYELNASKKQFPFQEFVASATTCQLTREISNPQEVSRAHLQQLNAVADVKQQLNLVARPQQCGQLIQPAASSVSSLSMPLAPSTSMHSYELHESKQMLPIQEFPGPATSQQFATTISNAWDVSAVNFQQLNLPLDNKQQPRSASKPQECAQMTHSLSSPVFSLPMPAVPSTSGLCHELNACKQLLPIQDFPAAAISQQHAATISNAQDVFAGYFQQQNLPADNKQSHLVTEPKEHTQVIQTVSSPAFALTMPMVPSISTHSNELNASRQQLPILEFPAPVTLASFSITMPMTTPTSSHSYELNASKQQLLQEFPVPVASPNFGLTMPTVPSTFTHSYEINATKQQLLNQQFPDVAISAISGLRMPMSPSTSALSSALNISQQQSPVAESAASVPLPNFGSTMPTVPSTSTHSYEINATKQQLPIQEFLDAAISPVSGLRMPVSPSTSAHLSALNACQQQSPIPELATPVASFLAAATSNKQEAFMLHDPQLNLVADGKQELHSVGRPPENGQVVQIDNSAVKMSAKDVPIDLHPFIGKMTTSQAFPVGVSGQEFNIASGCDFKGSIAGTQQLPMSVNTPELVKNISQDFPSPQGLYVPKNFGSLQGHLLQPCSEVVHPWQSFRSSASGQDSLPQAVQGCFSKPKETAHNLFSTELQRIPTNAAPDLISSPSCSFHLPTGIHALSEGIPDGSILSQHCGLPLQAGPHGMPTDISTENILLQDCGFPSPKIMLSKGFPISVPSGNMLTSVTSQHHVNFNVPDELSNALSISVQKNVTASKDEQCEAIKSQPATASFVSEIPAHETLRSAFNAVREEPDSFALKQQTMHSETPSEVSKNTIPTKQSIGKKRHIMDVTPALNTPNSMARSSFSNRSMDYLPHDDDVLASILGRTPAFKVRPSPAETMAPKRPRLTPRATVLKRKALIDVAVVLHGDFIRQQLVSTEDIRRVRKKAPCTRRETRVLQKESQAQQIFWEPSIPGLCMELCDLYDQAFGLNGVRLRHLYMNENSTETQRTQETGTSMEPTVEIRAAELEYVTSEQGERPAKMVSVLGSAGLRAEDVSEKQACEATSKQSAGEMAIAMNECPFEASKVTRADESFIIHSSYPERVLDNIVAIPPQDNVCANCEVAGMLDPSVFQNGCKNYTETNLTRCEPSVECKVGPDCLGADHEKPLENRGAIFLPENPESSVKIKNSSHFLFESHTVPVLLPAQDAVVEHVCEFRKVNRETELINKESNAVINAKEQIDDIEVVEEAVNNGAMDETLQENECKSQVVIDSETCIVSQKKECLANIGANNGVIVNQNMNKLVETVDTCFQEGVVENIWQDDQVAAYEMPREPDHKTAEEMGAGFLVDKAALNELTPEKVLAGSLVDKEALNEMPRELDHKTAEEMEAGSLVNKEALNELTPEKALAGSLVDKEALDDPTQEKVLATRREDKATVDATTYDDDGEHDDDLEFLGHSNNTEFLVADDETQVDAAVNTNVPNVEEDQIQENSGWSARTRAVSRYLKTVFDAMDNHSKKGEAESQRKLGLDRLLMGKTRKEAARMFFETLVLKTRDYVHVEQKNSFDDISIHPRAKLMKTNF